jgi:hypothetical protein
MNTKIENIKIPNYLIWGLILLVGIVSIDLVKMLWNSFDSLSVSGIYHYSGFLIIGLFIVMIGGLLYKIEYGLLSLFLFFPILSRFSEYFQFSMGEYSLTVDAALIYFLFTCNVIYRLKENLFIAKGLEKPLFLLSIFVIVTIISSLFNGATVSFNILWSGIIPAFLLYFLVVWNTRNTKQSIHLCIMLALILALAVTYIYYSPLIARHKGLEVFRDRWPSFFYNPIILAGALILLFPISFYFFQTSKNKIQKLIYFFLIVLSVLALMLTGSRGGFFVVLGQLFFLTIAPHLKKINKSFLLKGMKRSKVEIGILFLTLVGLSIFFFYHPPEVIQRFTHFNLHDPGYSGYERIMAIRGAFEIGMSHFWGVGVGNFQEGYFSTEAWRIGILKLESAHNFFLNIFAEQGVLGLLTFMTFLYLIHSYVKMNKKSDPQTAVLNRYISQSFYGYIAYCALFYGEFQHRSSSVPFFLFMTVCGQLTAAYVNGDIKREQ